MKRLSFVILAMALVLGVAGISFSQGGDKSDSQSVWRSATGSVSNKRVPRFVPGEILIQYKVGVYDAEKTSVRNRIGAELREQIVDHRWSMMVEALSVRNIAIEPKGDLELASLPAGMEVFEAIGRLQNDPAVKYAEPNWIYTHDATSNDPFYTGGSLYGMYGDGTAPANQFGSQAGEAWAANNVGSNTVYVGVIDEGLKLNHADLSANVWTNPFDSVDGVDNDGNGYVDDKNGWDFDGNNNSIYDGSQDDHGTHVSGTIGAKGGNGIGVAGVCWNVTLISAKFLGRNGGTTANAIKAVDYITDLKTRHGLNIVATNNSWGGGGFSQTLKDAIDRANAQNILFVAAAGNNGTNNDSTPHYPSSYTSANIIAVASITSSGAKSSFSNFGLTSVDIGAPGSSINSTLPTKQNSDTYGAYSGTSMATPHVTGGAALYAASHPGATAAQIKAAILSSAVPTASLSGKCVTGGRLNVSGF